MNLNQRSSPVDGIAGVNQYSVELTRLQDAVMYYFQVESANTIGSTSSEIGSFDIQNACTYNIIIMVCLHSTITRT
jgi:hypothetical protein